MEIYEPTMPTESIKIKFVGYLLRDAARRRYDTRKRTLETETNQIVGMPSPRHSLFDSQIVRRSGETTPSSKLLKYDGSIQGLQDLILQQIMPEIGRAIYHKAGTTPDYDAPISAIRECRIIEEEFTRDKNTMKGSSQKNPDSPSGGTRVLQANLEINNQESRNPVRANAPTRIQLPANPNRQILRKPRRLRVRGNRKEGFLSTHQYWETCKDAYQGVSWEETNKRKEMERDCRRCGHNGHQTLNC